MSSGEDTTARLGKLALERGFITAGQLRAALSELSRSGGPGGTPRPIQEILLEKGFLTRSQLDLLREEDDPTLKTRPAAAEPVPPGMGKLGKYALIRELGRGGMGIVYQATDTELHRTVALKMLLASALADPNESQLEQERFLREARLSANLTKHPNIVSVYEAGVSDGRRYLAMEYIEGMQMSRWRKSGSITIRQQVQVLRDVAVAAHHAHRQNIIHRDLKPDNILVDTHGQPHVTDFGLAKLVGQNVRISLTASGMIVGTPAYMSPEQALGEKGIDQRTDVYALGVMLYETLTGRLPFTGETAIEILMKAAKDPVPPPSSVVKSGSNPTLDRTIEGICLRALAKRPDDRYPTAAALAADLSRWLKGEEVKVAPAAHTRRKPVAPAPAPRRGLWVGLAAFAAMAIVVLVLLLSGGSEPAPERRPPVTDAARAREAELEARRRLEREDQELAATGSSRLREGKFDEATEIFERILRRDPAHHEAAAGLEAARVQETEASLAVADRLLKKGEYREAFRAYSRIAAKHPGNPRATAGVDDSERKMDEAIAAAKEAEIRARDERERQAAEAKRKEQEEANQKAQTDVKEAQPTGPSDSLPVRVLKGHKASVWSVAWSPDGHSLASGSVDTSIRLWSASTGAEARRIVEGTGVFGVIYSKDGKTLASGSVEGPVKLWDLQRDAPPRLFRGHQKMTTRLSFNSDGSLLATASADHTVKVWDLAAGTTVNTFPGSSLEISPAPLFLPDGKAIAVPSGADEVRFWDWKTGREVRPRIRHEGLSTLALSPDGRILATGGYDRRISLWNLASDGIAFRAWAAHGISVLAVAFSPDGRSLASAGGDGQVRLWDAASGRLVDTLAGHAGALNALAFSPDGKLLASGGSEGAVRLWVAERLPLEEAWKKSVDLMALVVPSRDSIRGTWTRKEGRLHSEPITNGLLRLPYEPPEEYDFRIIFTRKNGACATAQFFLHAGQQGYWDLAPGGTGIGDIDGVWARGNVTTTFNPVMNDVRYVSVVQVRRDRIRCWLNDEKRGEWVSSMGPLSAAPTWGMDVPGVIGLGNCETETLFEAVQLLEVTGKGRVRTDGPPARAPAPPPRTPPAPAPAPPPATLSLVPDYVAYWRFAEATGTTAVDASKYKLPARLAGTARWVPGRTGVSLDGYDSTIVLPQAAPIQKLREGDYSLSVWLKPEDFPGEQVHDGFPVVRLPWVTLYYLWTKCFMLQSSLQPPYGLAAAQAPVGSSSAGAWYHVVGVVNAAEGKMAVYLNGKPAAVADWTPRAAAGNMWPGVWAAGSSFSAQGERTRSGARGTLDALRLYGRVLSEKEAEAIYTGELPFHR